MKIYLNKLIAYLLVSLALSLVFGPFDGNPFKQQTNYSSMWDLCQQYPESCTEENSMVPPEFVYMKYIAGLSLLFLGLYFIRKSYTKQPGIPVNSHNMAIVSDTINILFLSFAAYCVWAVLIDGVWYTKPYLYDEFLFEMISFFFVPAVAIMTFFSANLAGQSIEIDKSGITIHYLDISEYILWKDVLSMSAKETFTVTEGGGILAPRKMQTKLFIKGKRKSMELYEPGYRKTKEKIVKQLQKFASDDLQKDISILDQEW